MKCPKCQYISYDQSDRCRNCGYEFSFSVEAPDLDLPIRTGDEAIGPLSDFALGDAVPPGAPVELADEPPPRHSPSQRSAELPLFRDRGTDDDAPLVSLPASPRAPVAVRKSTIARGTARPAEEPGLDLEPADAVGRSPATAHAAAADHQADAGGSAVAGPGARLAGALLDLLLLGAIDAGIVYLTLRFCELEFAEIGRIPIAPFLAFIALLNGGYMAAFTAAGGQSIGKMIAGTRVVTMDESAGTERVALGQAVLRAAAYLVSVVPAGLGFLPALFGAERRALHDRLAHTRVVKA